MYGVNFSSSFCPSISDLVSLAPCSPLACWSAVLVFASFPVWFSSLSPVARWCAALDLSGKVQSWGLEFQSTELEMLVVVVHSWGLEFQSSRLEMLEVVIRLWWLDLRYFGPFTPASRWGELSFRVWF